MRVKACHRCQNFPRVSGLVRGFRTSHGCQDISWLSGYVIGVGTCHEGQDLSGLVSGVRNCQDLLGVS